MNNFFWKYNNGQSRESEGLTFSCKPKGCKMRATSRTPRLCPFYSHTKLTAQKLQHISTYAHIFKYFFDLFTFYQIC